MKEKRVLYRPRKKKTAEDDAAIQYLQAQYDKINADEIRSFKDLPLSQKTLKALKENQYITPTEIQKQAIIYALQGKDILGAAKTGSGKTLAFLIPILENLFCKKWTRLDGVGALVISPTRELAYQIYETLRKVGRLHDFSAGLIIGGQNLKFEKKRMDQINILICTPGRLLQHMDENPLFDCSHLQILVLDEADRCLDLGFEATMNAIIENLPLGRQTLLFSATQTKSVKDLARLSLKFPTYVAPHEQAATVTPDSLQQSYIVCEIDQKIGIIWSFIRNHLKQKVLVFMATCKQVKYTYELFCKLRPGVSLLALYGSLHQEKREKIYNEFCRKSNVVLFATDLASRGLDFPRVNWVIQMDCPEDVDTYIHRAGRTARGVFSKGEGLLVLLPHEEKFVDDLKNSRVPINKIAVDPSKVQTPQKKIEALLSESNEFKQSAQRAFTSYVKAIFLMKNKQIFNIQLLDTDAYARSLGLVSPPYLKFLKRYQYAQQRIEKDKDDVLKKVMLKTESENDTDQNMDDVYIEDANLEQIIEKKNQKKKNVKFNFLCNTECVENDFLNVNQDDVDPGDQLTKEELVTFETNGKVISKMAMVKELLKKDVQVNKIVRFTEDGDAMDNTTRGLTLGLANCDFDPAKANELLQEEEKSDKPRFREKAKAKLKEKKRKIKNKNKEDDGEKDDFGSESESEGPDLSWLPDPYKVYGKSDENDSNLGSGSEATDDEEQLCEETVQKFHKPSKRKILDSNCASQDSSARKKRKVQDIAESLCVSEAEAFAMQLLQTNR